MSTSPVRAVVLDGRKSKCPMSFDELHELAKSQNVVLEREQKVELGERYAYNMYSNSNFVSEYFKTLSDVWIALVYDPSFQKEPRR